MSNGVITGGDLPPSLPPLRAGRIIYTNDLPVYAAFDAGAAVFPGVLHADVPARLNAMMLAGELDLSPVSAFAYIANADRLALLPDLCIGSRKEVWSVLLVSARPPQELDGAEIALTPESASGRSILRILLERRYGVDVRYRVDERVSDVALTGAPVLLIGDAAIEARSRVPAHWVHDLGKLWHEWTGVDMVYAVWTVRREVLAQRPADVAAALAAFAAARRWGAEHYDAVLAAAQSAHPRGPGFYRAYYETLHFDLDERALAGLRRFALEARLTGLIDVAPAAVPEEIPCHSLA